MMQLSLKDGWWVGPEERIALVRAARGHTAALFKDFPMRRQTMGRSFLPFRRFGAFHASLVLCVGANALLTPAGTAQEWEDIAPQGRPLICTEWLNRPRDSKMATCLPLFMEARFGAVNWGLVNDRTQTDLPWGHKPGKPYTGPWHHDLFRPNHSPDNAQEIGVFRKSVQQTKHPGTVTNTRN